MKDTLKENPKNISLLRLDTDWYESTKEELNILFPRLSRGGVLIVDDYKTWSGCKKAVDEYFKNKKNIFFTLIDNEALIGIKFKFVKILHLSFFDNYGGAAKAAYRVLNCQLNSKMQSDMMVFSKVFKNKNVFLIKSKFSLYLNNFIVSLLNFLLVKIYKKQSVYSLNIIPSNLSKKINKSDYDIVNFSLDKS